MNADNVLSGIDASDRITQGMFFRLTLARTRYGPLRIEVFAFQHDAQALFDSLDAPDGWAQPVSDLAVLPGQEAAVFDVLVRPAVVGITAAYLANYFDDLRFGVTLTSMTLIDVSAVQSGADERSNLQRQLDEAAKKNDPLSALGGYGKYLQWILILLVVLALLYYGQKAFRLVRAVV